MLTTLSYSPVNNCLCRFKQAAYAPASSSLAPAHPELKWISTPSSAPTQASAGWKEPEESVRVWVCVSAN